MNYRPFSHFQASLYASFFFISLTLFSCKENDVKTPVRPNYFPLQTGKFYIYTVDSIRYYNVPFSVKSPDTARFQLKDSVESKFKDLAGNTVYRIEEFRRFTNNDNWKLLKVFTRSANDFEAQETDGNIRYVKLSFPVSQGQSWNANKYNTLDSSHHLSSTYISVNQPWSVSGLNFNYTTLVQVQNDSNLIEKYLQFERYAGDVGLVYRRHDSVINNTPDPQSVTVLQGYKRQQVLTNYGPR
jgi:hypothetical protein